MANPQVESGHIRIANELYDEILRRNFTKRQQNLVLFIWRLSYGTGQKDCEVKHFNLFELAGLYRSDVRKELNYLKECSVLNWDEENMIFSINKNYKLWQISPNKNWDSDKFNALIHQNIVRKNVSKSLTKDTKKVSETPTNPNSEVSETLTSENKPVSESLTKTDENVSKSLTTELVKHQQAPSEKSTVSRDTESLYTLLEPYIKDINNNNSFYKQQSASQFYEENGFGVIGGLAAENLMYWLEKFNDEILILAMREAVENDARHWKYLNSVLSDWEKKGVKTANDAKAAIAEFREKKKSRYQSNSKNYSQEVIPDWFEDRNRKKTKKETVKKTVDENDSNIIEMQKIIEKYKTNGG